MRSTFTFNGHCSDEFGVYISEKPKISRSARKYQVASVSGRNGNIYRLQDAWEEVVVSYNIFAGGYNEGDATRDFTDIMEWLNSADDYAVLMDSYDITHYRMAVFVDATTIEQKWYSTGKAVIQFRCKPQHYLGGGSITVEDGDTIINPTNHIALPFITLTGSGASSLLNLEKNDPDANVSSPMYSGSLMTDFGYISIGIAYNNRINVAQYTPAYAASHSAGISTRTNTSGTLTWNQWEDITGVGTCIETNPDTEYTLTFTADRDCKAYIGFWGSDGMISDKIEKQTAGGDVEFSFRTPADCNKILIVFFTTGTSNVTLSSIMVSKGSAQPFKPWVADTTETIMIGDTKLKIMLNGFNTAEIDCERENFSVDGVDSNTSVSVVDEYDNQSVEYLRLKKGNNPISISSGITSVLMDCRFWEL